MADFEEQLTKVNDQLEILKIRARGNRLSIRGTFPPKPGHGDLPKEYDVATGKPLTPRGLKMAKAIATEMESLLLQNRFDWRPYLKGKQRLPETVADWIERYVADHWQHVERNPGREATFRKDYLLHFEKLPQDAPLTVDLLEKILLEKSKPQSRARKGYAMAYWRLAEFAGLPTKSLKHWGSGYTSKQVNPRDLPKDEMIAAAWEIIKDPDWRWIFEAMAVYGIRPHEAFFATPAMLEDVHVLEIPDDTKTGRHIAFPMQATTWSFSAQAHYLPDVKLEGLTNRQIGMKVSPKFKQWGFSFVPYDLRHAYARRGYEMEFPPEFLARSMGHSYAVHCTTYKAWIGQDADLKLYKKILGI